MCLVTSRRALAPDARTTSGELLALAGLLDQAIESGVDVIQIRERDLDARVLLDFSRRIVERAGGTGTVVIVNDRTDVAAAAGADGVHLRSDGPPAAAVRSLLPAGALVGRSIHDDREARDTADYFVFGAVFPSGSKPVAGPAGLEAAVRMTTAPVLAIGGVTPENAAACRAAGAAGIAAISVFLPPGRTPGSLGPAAAISALRAAWHV